LFGWSFRDVGGYAIATNNGRPVCGLLQRERPTNRPAKPRWISFISVPSVAEAQKQALARGALVRAAPQKFPQRGEQAVFADAEGAAFGVIYSSAGDPEDSLAEPGAWIWMQLLSRNVVAAADFYEAVCGYKTGPNTISGRSDSRLLSSGGFARAAVRAIPADHPEVTPTWLPFVRVTSAAQSAARAKQLGGTVLVEPSPELFDGRVAVVADPTGAAIGLLEWNELPPRGGQAK
jgi:predicted enzyme related to lactoylglutathione lyase